MNLSKIIIVLILSFTGLNGFAQDAASSDSPTIGSSEVGSGVSALSAITGDSRVTSVMNGYMAYEFWEKGNAVGWTGSGTFFYAMSALEVAQGVMNLTTSGEGNNAQNYLSNSGLGQGGGNGNGNNLNDNDVLNDPGMSDKGFQDFLSENELSNEFGKNVPNPFKLARKLSKKGYKVDPKTGKVTLPNGKTLTGDDLAKNAEVNKLLNSSKFKKMQADFLKKRGRYLNRISRLKNRGSGGFVSNNGKKKKKKDSYGGYSFDKGESSARKPASLPVKMVNGDPLGAAADNVFDIVERSYQDLVTKKVLNQNLKKKK